MERNPPSARARTDTPVFDRVDLVYVQVLFSVGFFTLLLWAWVNGARTPLLLAEVGLLAISVALASWCVRDLPRAPVRSVWPHLVLGAGILITVYHWVEPALAFPEFPIGYQFKDLHDGLILYLRDHGAPPVRGFLPSEGVDVPWIATDRGGLWSAYPNAMHCLAAFLAKLGFPAIHASLAAMLLAAVATSYATYLAIKRLTGRPEIAALVGGLVTLTSFRVPLSFAITPPQGFALALCFPVVWALWFAEEHRGWRRSLAAGLMTGALAASYNGPVVLVLGGVAVVLAARLALDRDRAWVKRWIPSAVCIAGALGIVAIGQGRIYWTNTFGELLGGNPVYDPTETSHFLLPFARPLYLLFLVPAVALYLRKGLHRTPLGSMVLGFAILLSLTLPYDALIHARNQLHTWEDHMAIPPDGIFGGAKHQKISRVALMQPFFFAAILGAIGLALRKPWQRWAVGAAMVVPLALTHLSLPLYTMVEVLPYDFVKREAAPVSAALSDYVFCNPPDNWNADFQTAIRWVDENTAPADRVAYLPGERWYNNRHVWSSVFLQREVATWQDLGLGRNWGPPEERVLDEGEAALVFRQGYSALLLDHPAEATVLALESSPLWSLVHRVSDYFVYARSRRPQSFESDLARALWVDPRRGSIDLGAPSSLVFLSTGWSPPHQVGPMNFAKVMGDRASLYLPLEDPQDLSVSLRARSNEDCLRQRVTPVVGSVALEAVPLGTDWETIRFDVPASLLEPGLNVLELRFSETVSPEQATGGRIPDPNPFAALVDELSIEIQRPPRDRLVDGFAGDSGRWTALNGDWQLADGRLRQLDAWCADATYLLQDSTGPEFAIEARFRALGEGLGVGFARGSAATAESGVDLMQLVDRGRYLRWGRLGPGTRYTGDGGTPVGIDAADGEWHVMRLEVYGDVNVFRLDGVRIATVEHRPVNDRIGLFVTGSAVEFDWVTLDVERPPSLASATAGL